MFPLPSVEAPQLTHSSCSSATPFPAVRCNSARAAPLPLPYARGIVTSMKSDLLYNLNKGRILIMEDCSLGSFSMMIGKKCPTGDLRHLPA